MGRGKARFLRYVLLQCFCGKKYRAKGLSGNLSKNNPSDSTITSPDRSERDTAGETERMASSPADTTTAACTN